jgi:hypothetical protein
MGPIRPYLLVAALLAGAPATATPSRTRSLRVKVGNGTRRGIGLHGAADGWHLELARGDAHRLAEVIDVTPGAPARTLTLAVGNDEVVLDPRRFVGGHVYQVLLLGDDVRQETRWVFLFPSATRTKDSPQPPPKEPQKIKFVDDEKPAGDDAIQPVQKSF